MWPDARHTQVLLERAAADPAAVDTLLAQHREPLRRAVAVRLDPQLARRVDASDIVQDVLTEASGRLRDYLKNPTIPFALWLRQIAQDRLIDAYRFHRKAARRSLDREQPVGPPAWSDASSVQLMRELIDPVPTPGTAALRHELEQRLGVALARLDDPDREVILLRHLEGLSNQDVAAQYGLSEAAASMRYMRALRRLRAELTGDEPSQD